MRTILPVTGLFLARKRPLTLLTWGRSLCVGALLSYPSSLRAEAPQPHPLASPHATSPAQAAPPVADEALSRQVLVLLTAGIEKQPSQKALLALGPGLSRALIAVFEDEAAPRHARLRALSLLGAVADEHALAYLTELATRDPASPKRSARAGSLDPARSPTALRRILEALAQAHTTQSAAPKSRARTAETARLAEAHLAHDDAQVRKWAVRLLELDPSEDATRSLQLQRERERSPLVRDALSAALKGRLAPRAIPRQDVPKTDSPPR